MMSAFSFAAGFASAMFTVFLVAVAASVVSCNDEERQWRKAAEAYRRKKSRKGGAK